MASTVATAYRPYFLAMILIIETTKNNLLHDAVLCTMKSHPTILYIWHLITLFCIFVLVRLTNGQNLLIDELIGYEFYFC